jgi:GSCFA family
MTEHTLTATAMLYVCVYITGRAALRSSRAVFITVGTAWVYEYDASALQTPSGSSSDISSTTTSASSAVIAGNCHKLPQSMFKRRLMGINEIAQHLQDVVQVLTVQLGVQQVRQSCDKKYTMFCRIAVER